jgi:chromosome segregation ATPase
MVQKYSILIFSAIVLVFTSCVSKKKYVEMQNGRLKAEQQSRRLSDENNEKAARISALIADYERMKNDLLENNAIKDQYIDSLNSEVYLLIEELNKQKESLQTTSFNLDFEKQRLTSALESKDKAISSLQSQVEQLETEVSNKNSVIDQKNFEIGKLEDQILVEKGKVGSGVAEISKLESELNNVKTETVKLQEQLKEKDASIARLENNVKLLKKELGGS